MTRPLAILCQSLQTLVDELHIAGIDVEAQQHQASGRHATDTVQESKGLQNQVIRVLATSLLPQVVLQDRKWVESKCLPNLKIHYSIS